MQPRVSKVFTTKQLLKNCEYFYTSGTSAIGPRSNVRVPRFKHFPGGNTPECLDLNIFLEGIPPHPPYDNSPFHNLPSQITFLHAIISKYYH